MKFILLFALTVSVVVPSSCSSCAGPQPGNSDTVSATTAPAIQPVAAPDTTKHAAKPTPPPPSTPTPKETEDEGNTNTTEVRVEKGEQ